MVGQQFLVLFIGVRIPVPEPHDILYRQMLLFLYPNYGYF